VLTFYGSVKAILTAMRALVYATAFLAAWGWLALQTRRLDAEMGVPLPPEVHAVGVALLVLGGGLALWCVALFVWLGRGTAAPFDPPRRFVAVGPYRWVRNPMYLGCLRMLAGFGLGHTSPAMLLFTLPAAATAHLFVILYEEPTLERRFGASYVEYKDTVNRWLPRAARRGPHGR
jgi:protein-S-isoprenylcysteine O-methyltransferase Ste14